MTSTPTWNQMRLLPRISTSVLATAEIPSGPGVFVWFRNGEPVQVGKATGPGGLRRQLQPPTGAEPDDGASRWERAGHRITTFGREQLAAIRRSVGSRTQAERVESFIAESSVAWLEMSDTTTTRAAWKALMTDWQPTRGPDGRTR
ncbi:hypothetical protein D1871_08140 [Nakamurella silvestris]|nr:hypothetical protein D1871_08140 [Nakamurella silvestris]